MTQGVLFARPHREQIILLTRSDREFNYKLVVCDAAFNLTALTSKIGDKTTKTCNEEMHLYKIFIRRIYIIKCDSFISVMFDEFFFVFFPGSFCVTRWLMDFCCAFCDDLLLCLACAYIFFFVQIYLCVCVCANSTHKALNHRENIYRDFPPPPQKKNCNILLLIAFEQARTWQII